MARYFVMHEDGTIIHDGIERLEAGRTILAAIVEDYTQRGMPADLDLYEDDGRGAFRQVDGGTKPDWQDDGQAGWLVSGPFDVEADPTGRHPSVTLRNGSGHFTMTPDEARRLADALRTAADYR